MTDRSETLFEIGVVVRPQGLKGEIKIQPWTDNAEQWLDFSHCLRKINGNMREEPIESVRVQDGFVYVRLQGVEDRDKAEALRGAVLSIERKYLPEPEEGAYFIADLIGCRVWDDEGRELGVMKDVWNYPANDVYVVKTVKGEVLVPALKTVLASVDVDEKKIVFHAARLREVADFED